MDGLDKKRLGRNIRQARYRLGLTQEQMAELIDMAPEVYGRMERGQLVPRLERFVALCRALGESPDKLIFPLDAQEALESLEEIKVGTEASIKALREAFATNLRDSRQRVGWTQAEIAEKARMSVDVYGRIERGTILPTLEAFVDICRVLGEMSDRLLGLPPPKRMRRRR
ncbi:helix-turn-helix domain-containing protein [Hyalangium minutum]|uniref:Putative transcriptional repressor n=1 Tax=Hyalangium minutum TaxID=394096 RepID=A0A085W3N5_9BACT|nr:helix-turn-helix transcriptional regulator [Hyalangium minutum]KFE62298.1 putative transcriptional repressor [Hyalangium minutum]